MKRGVCLLLVVSIAYAGCADKKQNKVTVVSLPGVWVQGDDWKSNAVLMQENVRLRDELYKVKTMHKPNKALLVRIDDLETALESQRAVSRAVTAKLKSVQSEGKIMHKQNEALLVKIYDLETALVLRPRNKVC